MESSGTFSSWSYHSPLQWRHNEHDHDRQLHGCLLNRLFRHRSKKTSKLRVTGLCAGNSPVTGEFPAQTAIYAWNVSFDGVIMLCVLSFGTQCLASFIAVTISIDDLSRMLWETLYDIGYLYMWYRIFLRIPNSHFTLSFVATICIFIAVDMENSCV